MDKIRISNIQLFAFHGVVPEEQKLGQKFEIDVELKLQKFQTGTCDDLSKTVDYSHVYDIVKREFLKKKYKLLETVGDIISSELIKLKYVEQVVMKIRKPNAPINGQFDFVEIEIERAKS